MNNTKFRETYTKILNDYEKRMEVVDQIEKILIKGVIYDILDIG